MAAHKQSSFPTVAVLATLWGSHFVKAGKYRTAKLTPREYGQLKSLRDSLGGSTTEILEWVLNNWQSFACKASEMSSVSSWPANPHIGFLLVHRTVAVGLQHTATMVSTADAMLSIQSV